MVMNKNEMEFHNNFSNLGALTIYYVLHGLHKEPFEDFLSFEHLGNDKYSNVMTPFYKAQLTGLIHFVSNVIKKAAQTLNIDGAYIDYLLDRFEDLCVSQNIINVLLLIQQNATEEKSPLLTTIATQIVKLFDDNVMEVIESFFVSEDFIYCKEIIKKVASLETDSENNFFIKIREKIDDEILVALGDSLEKKGVSLYNFAILVEANKNA